MTPRSATVVTALRAAPAGFGRWLARWSWSATSYQPFGPLKQLTYGNGLTLNRTYDQNYWQTGTKVSATGVTRLDLTFSRNDNGQLSHVTDNAVTGRDADFGYTDAGRLQYGVGPWGDQGYGYDASGNRTDYQSTVGGVTTYEYEGNSGSNNRTTYVVDGASAPLRNLAYRDGGDLYEDARVGGSTYQYYYNARKRLVAVNKDTVDQAYYAYDYRGQRVARSILTPTWSAVHYIYDLEGHLIAEHNGDTGAVIKQYIWLDDTPLAVIDKSSGTEQLYFIHTGQLEEPLVMTDAAKAKVWDGYVEPFGKAQVFGTATASLDLRLPGQWTQLESGGLSQNWYRDYDPSLGRYVQGDPLGLRGGSNIYSYVDGRPTEYWDATGQCPWCVPVIVGALIGGGTDLVFQLASNGGRFECVNWWSVAGNAAIGAITEGGLSGVPKVLKLNRLADDLAEWLEPGFKKFTNEAEDLRFRSSDNTKQIRFDLKDFHGDPEGPHINLETWKRRDLYPGDRTMQPITNEHIHFDK